MTLPRFVLRVVFSCFLFSAVGCGDLLLRPEVATQPVSSQSVASRKFVRMAWLLYDTGKVRNNLISNWKSMMEKVDECISQNVISAVVIKRETWEPKDDRDDFWKSFAEQQKLDLLVRAYINPIDYNRDIPIQFRDKQGKLIEEEQTGSIVGYHMWQQKQKKSTGQENAYFCEHLQRVILALK